VVYFITGILQECLSETHSAISQAWHLRWWES